MNPKTSSQALSQLQTAEKQVQSPTAILSAREAALGIPQSQQQVSGLRQSITNTTNLLNQVAPSVYGRTGGSLVTQAQATRQIGNEEAPIQEKLSGLGQQYSQASTDLSSNVARAQQQASAEQQAQQDRLSGLRTIYSALYGREQDALAHQLEQQKLALARSQAASGGIDIGRIINAVNKSKAAPSTATKATVAGPAKSAQEQGYDFVANMRDTGASQAQVVSDFNATKNWYEKTGNQKDYYKLLAYQEMFPDILGHAAYNQIKGLRF